MQIRSLLAAGLLAMALPSFANAATAYAVGGITNMREGPGTQYHVIARVRGDSRVDVVGCLKDFSWCDAIVEDIRGWISTTRLEFVHAERRVPLWSFYTFFNVPIIGDSSGHRRGGDDGASLPDCSDPDIICPDERPTVEEGPVECEACPWPSGRAPGTEGQ